MPKKPGSGIRHLPFDIKQRAALGILACALTALVYQTAFDLPFVFEDRTTVLLNPSLVQPWDFAAIVGRDLPSVAVMLTYAFDRAFWGFSSFGFHLSNFVLHVIVVGLFYGTCTRALTDGARPGSDWAAFFVDDRRLLGDGNSRFAVVADAARSLRSLAGGAVDQLPRRGNSALFFAGWQPGGILVERRGAR